MVELDWIIIAVVILFALLGVLHGAVKELLSIVAWVTAFWAASHFANRMAAWLPASLSQPVLRHGVGFVLIVMVVLMLGALLNWGLTSSVNALGLGGANRFFGLLLGGLRGAFVIVLLVWLAGWTALPHTQWWKSSHLAGQFVTVVQVLKHLLPIDVSKNLRY